MRAPPQRTSSSLASHQTAVPAVSKPSGVSREKTHKMECFLCVVEIVNTLIDQNTQI